MIGVPCGRAVVFPDDEEARPCGDADDEGIVLCDDCVERPEGRAILSDPPYFYDFDD